jgi:hypothetical protein
LVSVRGIASSGRPVRVLFVKNLIPYPT